MCQFPYDILKREKYIKYEESFAYLKVHTVQTCVHTNVQIHPPTLLLIHISSRKWFIVSKVACQSGSSASSKSDGRPKGHFFLPIFLSLCHDSLSLCVCLSHSLSLFSALLLSSVSANEQMLQGCWMWDDGVCLWQSEPNGKRFGVHARICVCAWYAYAFPASQAASCCTLMLESL